MDQWGNHMPVPKITADEFATQLNNSILSKNEAHDVEIGPIPDIIVEPAAQLFESQNDRIREISNLILLNGQENFNESDVDDFVYNEFLIRNDGGRSSTTVIFSRATQPQLDLTVQKNFPIATNPNEETGETVVFVTTEEKTLYFASVSSYFNINTNRYELEVAVQATISGKSGEVGPGSINRPLRPLSGFDSVSNKYKSSTVTDRETNTQLLDRYKSAIIGSQISTPAGLKLFINSRFSDAGGVLVVTAEDPLVTRAATDSGAIDVFITGSQSAARQDTKQFLGAGQLIVLDRQPVINITNIPGYILGTDYELVKDESGVSGSTRAQDGIKFLATGSTPVIGSTITINYEQDLLISNIQSVFQDPDTKVGGQDPLVRMGTQVDITLTARLIVLPGFSFTTLQSAVITTILDFINALNLGDDVERSDIQAEVRNISGVDNFIFQILDKVGGTGLNDVIIDKNEFARTSNIYITILA